MLSHTVTIQQHLLKGGRIQNRNACQHQIRMRKNSGSLKLHLITNPTADEKWVSQLSSVAQISSSSENDVTYAIQIDSNFL